MAKLFILSAPSGTGKSTIAEKLLQQIEGMKKVVTATTREPRPGERHGIDYIFMSKQEFEEGIRKGLFLEYANVYGNYYGTPKDQIERNMREGYDSLLVIDVQGAFKVKSINPEAISVFVLPPSLEELRRRIIGRGFKDSNVQERLSTAKGEIPCARNFDYIIINDFINKAVEQVKSIIVASRCERDSVLSNLRNLLHNEELIELIEGGDCYVKET
ncbi:guanylate kinase [Hydrogenivirga caldilitoris]|uniref:Guanylate kinase n=1 Tax=Hydrogenivirga caldilitoris TaxID=246264 RepID=A0A497XPE7_9AQUI|nr:guanylate kinase [Hydrogenivirga caldilitoris]RLJ69989.1 guanylate kinase [Hydrogenivirga caldilitoris]